MSILTFPSTLREKIASDDSFPHIEFSIVGTGTEYERIHLFIPLAISVSDGVNYSSVNLGTTGAFAQTEGASESVVGKALGLSGDKKAGTSDFVANATKTVKTKVGGAMSEASVIFELKSGLVVNPFTTLNFDNISLRSFNFGFKLVPTSYEESKTIHSIENLFRKYMYPASAGAGALRYPPTFRIRFMVGGQENKYLPRIIQCYLTSMQATSNSTGNAFFPNDGMGAPPSEVDIALTFQEVRAILRDDLYESGLMYSDDRENDGFTTGDPTDTVGAVNLAAEKTKQGVVAGAKATGNAIQQGGAAVGNAFSNVTGGKGGGASNNPPKRPGGF